MQANLNCLILLPGSIGSRTEIYRFFGLLFFRGVPWPMIAGQFSHTATSIVLFIKVRLLLIFVSSFAFFQLVCAKIVASVKCGFYVPHFGVVQIGSISPLETLCTHRELKCQKMRRKSPSPSPSPSSNETSIQTKGLTAIKF